MTLAYAFAHCAVDFACVATVLSLVGVTSASQLATTILAYDLLAFCMQLPLGALLDRLDHETAQAAARDRIPLIAALTSLALTGAGALVGGAAPVIATLCVALGNALFHDAGGVAVLDHSATPQARPQATRRATYRGAYRATPSGVFISTGAFGVFAGTLLAGKAAAPALVAPLTAAAVVLLAQRRLSHQDDSPIADNSTNESVGEKGMASSPVTGRLIAAVVLICVTVGLRSYAGAAMAFPWKAGALSWAAIASVIAGKALGGVVADRTGLLHAGVISLAGAAVLFPFSWGNPTLGVAATMLFNFTMPVTLVVLANLLRPQRGLAFGLASFSLAIGALPALMLPIPASPLLLVGLSLASLAALVAGLALSHDDAC